jgi:hypothetical protein
MITQMSAVMYHGSDKKFKSFRCPTKNTVRGKGLFFSDSLRYARTFGRYVYLCKVLLQNPRIYPDSVDYEIDRSKHQGVGVDIVIVRSQVSTGIVKEVICFSPESIEIVSLMFG